MKLIARELAILYKAAINLKPYQGLKRKGTTQSERTVNTAAINLKPYQGLKRGLDAIPPFSILRKAAINLKPYQGLKRGQHTAPAYSIHKTGAAINLKPYQGLKLKWDKMISQRPKAAINLKPYQGLKRESLHCLSPKEIRPQLT